MLLLCQAYNMMCNSSWISHAWSRTVDTNDGSI